MFWWNNILPIRRTRYYCSCEHFSVKYFFILKIEYQTFFTIIKGSHIYPPALLSAPQPSAPVLRPP